MLSNSTPITALIITLITGVIGIVLFFGSIHGGGTPFYLAMVFLPPLYLLYADLIPINNLLVIIGLVLLIQDLFWLLVIFVFKKALDSSYGNNKTI